MLYWFKSKKQRRRLHHVYEDRD